MSRRDMDIEMVPARPAENLDVTARSLLAQWLPDCAECGRRAIATRIRSRSMRTGSSAPGRRSPVLPTRLSKGAILEHTTAASIGALVLLGEPGAGKTTVFKELTKGPPSLADGAEPERPALPRRPGGARLAGWIVLMMPRGPLFFWLPIGVHRTYMGGLERGERNLTLKSLERIAGKIKVEPLELLRSPCPNGG